MRAPIQRVVDGARARGRPRSARRANARRRARRAVAAARRRHVPKLRRAKRCLLEGLAARARRPARRALNARSASRSAARSTTDAREKVEQAAAWRARARTLEMALDEEVRDPAVLTLDLRGRGLRGCIPLGLVRLKRLVALSLSANMLEGHIPRELGGLRSLRGVSLGRTA